jgi:hypothetical protein
VRVTEFQDGRRFRWEGSFLWLGLGYDHLVTTDEMCRVTITFTVDAAGLGVNTIGPLFAASPPATWTVRSPDCRPSCDHPIRHGPSRALVLDEPTGGSTRSIEAISGGLATAAFGGRDRLCGRSGT